MINKSLFLVVVMSLIVFIFTSCDEYLPEISAEPPAISTVSEITPATVSEVPLEYHGIPIHFFGEVLYEETNENELAKYPDAPRYMREIGSWVSFGFTESVKDVVLARIFNVCFDDEARVHTYAMAVFLTRWAISMQTNHFSFFHTFTLAPCREKH